METWRVGHSRSGGRSQGHSVSRTSTLLSGRRVRPTRRISTVNYIYSLPVGKSSAGETRPPGIFQPRDSRRPTREASGWVGVVKVSGPSGTDLPNYRGRAFHVTGHLFRIDIIK